MGDLENFGVYKYVLLIGLIGGILGIFSKKELENCENRRCKVARFFLGCAVSMFSGYLGYELAFYITGAQNLSIAAAGLSGWIGHNGIIAAATAALAFIEPKRPREF